MGTEKGPTNEAGEALGRVWGVSKFVESWIFQPHFAEYSNNYAGFGMDLLDFFRETTILSKFG